MPNGKTKPRYEDKCWGNVLHGFVNSNVAVSILNLNRDTWCSKHIHKERANVFWNLSALVEVQEWDLDGNEVITLLEPGDVYEVPSRTLHRFRVLEDGQMVEIYYADRGGEVSAEDIDRKELGGRYDG